MKTLRLAAERHEGGLLRVAVAWAKDAGVIWFLDAVHARVGSIEVVVGLNERGTTVEALLRLQASVSSLRYLYKHPRQTFHPKLYWFLDDQVDPSSGTVIVGSSNVTKGGLVTNYEASLVIETAPLGDTGRQLASSIEGYWNSVVSSPWTHQVQSEADVERLYREGYLKLEATVRAERRRSGRGDSKRAYLPVAPPPRVEDPPSTEVVVPFSTEPELPEEPAPVDADPEGVPPLSERFFVRTLTSNDVEKLHGNRTGTFEPDLGEMARDRFPAFWGWPQEYEVVVRDLPRKELNARGRLISRLTPPEGVEIEVVLWFREPREGHAAEHRLRPGPISTVREAVPPDFDSNSLLVVERATEDAEYDFILRLVTPGDPGFQDYSDYLSEDRPQHRFGYGP